MKRLCFLILLACVFGLCGQSFRTGIGIGSYNLNRQQQQSGNRIAPAAGGGGSSPVLIDLYTNAIGGANHTWSPTVTINGSANLAIAHINSYDPVVGGSNTDVTINGVNMNLLIRTNVHNGLSIAEIWYLSSPPTGSRTLSITSAGNNTIFGVGFITFSGANGATPINLLTNDYIGASTRHGMTNVSVSAVNRIVINYELGDLAIPALTPTREDPSQTDITYFADGVNSWEFRLTSIAGAATVTGSFTNKPQVLTDFQYEVKP